MKSFIPSFILVGAGALCIAAFWMIGSHVMPDGRLVEPFFLTAIGALLITAGVVVGILVALVAVIKLFRKKAKN